MDYFLEGLYILLASFGVVMIFTASLLDIVIPVWLYGIIGAVYVVFIIGLLTKK